jgi:Domain of unknown function (DUF4276)
VSAEVSLEVLVEEPSMERALRLLLPKIVPCVRFEIRDFRGKTTLLRELPNRLCGYRAWIATTSIRLVVVVDRDGDDCIELKDRLRQIAEQAGLRTGIEVLNRIAIEELEAWYFGDILALCRAYPKVPASLGQKAGYRDPDAITGGTWEALERVLQNHGYHVTGLRKLHAANDIAPHMDVESNLSKSFQVFRDGLRHLVGGRGHAS